MIFGVEDSNFLGCRIPDRLDISKHVDQMCAKLRKSVSLVMKIGRAAGRTIGRLTTPM